LDPEARDDLASLLTSLRDAGMTIVVSSHILAELEAYSSHMLIIDQGQIVDHAGVGAPSTLGDTVQIMVALSEPHTDLQNLLADKVENLDLSDKTARFSLKGGIAAQQALLKALVSRGVPVISFGPERINLQDTYIERVREGRTS
jgi:ABC-2 type transport system ATP-binding protein